MRKLIPISLALIIAALFALNLDQIISLWFDGTARDSWRHFALDITDIGLAEQWFFLAALTMLFTSLSLRYKPQSINREKLLNLNRWSQYFFCSLMVSGFFLQLTKICFGRQRPHISLDRNPLVFHPFNLNWDFQSFPSGHTQTLFTVASLFIVLWPKQAKIIWFAAGALAFTRVMALQHFVSDLIGGALIGIYASQLTFWLLRKKIPEPQAYTQ